MLAGRRYRLALTSEQVEMCEEFGSICRSVWNTALEQRREYRRRGAWMNYVPWAVELAEAKRELAWLCAAPSHVLQQTLRDLDRACREHGTFKVRWRSKARWSPSFRFPAGNLITVERLNRKWARAKLPKLGWVTFRWSRPVGGEIRSVAEKARAQGDEAGADRIKANNLGTVKRNRRRHAFEARVRSVTFTAVHAVAGKARHVVAEDVTRPFVSRKKLGKNTNRRLAMWTKGVTAEALHSVSERRGSALTLVNAAYTSQVAPCCRILGKRQGDRLHRTRCGAVWQADHAGAINVLERDGDPDISLYTPHTRVKQILQERADRHRTRLPVQDSSTPARRANHPIRATTLKE